MQIRNPLSKSLLSPLQLLHLIIVINMRKHTAKKQSFFGILALSYVQSLLMILFCIDPQNDAERQNKKNSKRVALTCVCDMNNS